MRASARVALRPNNEAPRAVLADRRGTTNYINSVSTTEISAESQQIQLLMTRYRLSAVVAGVAASLIWGGSNA